MDSEVKKQLDVFCSQVGMNTTVVFNMFARAVLREKRLPFEVTTESNKFYSENNAMLLRQNIGDLNNRKNFPAFSSVRIKTKGFKFDREFANER